MLSQDFNRCFESRVILGKTPQEAALRTVLSSMPKILIENTLGWPIAFMFKAALACLVILFLARWATYLSRYFVLTSAKTGEWYPNPNPGFGYGCGGGGGGGGGHDKHV